MILSWVPFLTMVVIVFTFSSQPYKEQNIQPLLQAVVEKETLKEVLPYVRFNYKNSLVTAKEDPYGFVELFIRKGMHLFIYALVGITGLFAVRRVGLSLLFVIVVASLDEWNQATGEGRTGTPLDVGVDLLGGLIGLSIVGLVILIRSHHSKKVV